ncbi:homoserine O-succinyltransferase [uncultured Vagococcus sp.]|uniref:homoserine O-acetyltransferase/O-succinyltransferase family protein n=1 Tax=uncultured Vagococcus sp. TaxID=189676 RepID=UPI0028CFE3DB|nr:homoserine O-succinyltransferase [uncultured Vagococcus sp.]
MTKKGLTIAILNLMPTKEATANQLTELVTAGNEQVEVLLLYPESHYENKVLPDLLARDYFPFSLIKERVVDGVIVTGAPVEQLAFDQVDYWPELCETLSVIREKDIPILAICWGAQAALYHYYQIDKLTLRNKVVGVFDHQLRVKNHPIFKHLSASFKAPHSRYTTVDQTQVLTHPDLVNVADSTEAGLYLVTNRSGRETFVFGHAEYERDTLNLEYQRDLVSDSEAPFPQGYYPNNQVDLEPIKTWASHGRSLFGQWIHSLAGIYTVS